MYTSSNFSSIDSEDNQGLTEEQATFRRLLIRNHKESLMLLKIQSKEDKEHFLLLHPHYTAERALHEQFLVNAKTPNGYTNIKNALLISLAALNELCKQDNTFVSSPIYTTDTTTPMANPKIPYKSLTDSPNDVCNTGMRIGMNTAESLPTSPPSPIASAFSPITTTNNNNTPINSTVQVQDTTPVNNSTTYTSPVPTLNMISPNKLKHGVLVNPTIEKFNTLLAQHSKDYSHFISLQTKNLRKIFCNIHPLYNAESTLASNYYAVRRNIDDPYSEYFAK